MMKQIWRHFGHQSIRNFSVSRQNNFKVTVCGGAGGIGQPLSLLLKLNPLVTELNVFDVVHAPGVAADLSHVDTDSKVTGYLGPENLGEALKGSNIVVVPAGVPRKPGMTRDDLFNVNAGIIRDISKEVAKSCPKAFFAIITNPVNSCVPIAAEVLQSAGVYDPKRLFGVTTLDCVRARRFIGEILCVDPKKVNVPVIGGHAGATIMPILSKSDPCVKLDPEATKKLITRIQEGGTEVVQAKAGAGSATLSMAHAGATFCNALLRALKGDSDVIEYAYVESNVTEAAYFSTALKLGKEGIVENMGLPEMNDMEKELVKKALPELISSIKKGQDFVKSSC